MYCMPLQRTVLLLEIDKIVASACYRALISLLFTPFLLAFRFFFLLPWSFAVVTPYAATFLPMLVIRIWTGHLEASKVLVCDVDFWMLFNEICIIRIDLILWRRLLLESGSWAQITLVMFLSSRRIDIAG